MGIDRVIDLDKTLGPSPTDTNTPLAERKAMRGRDSGYHGRTPIDLSGLPSETTPMKRDRYTHGRFLEILDKFYI